MKHSQKIRDFIASVEGFRGTAYKPLANDKWTVGYGFTTLYGVPVKEGDTITQDKALLFLDSLLTNLDSSLNIRKIPDKVTQNQYDAVVSLVYNIGYGNFINSNTGKLFYGGSSISDKFPQWSMSGGIKIQGLLNRRNKEKKIYDTGNYE